MSSAYRQDFGVDLQCLDRRRTTPLSHDFLFHVVIGMLDIATTARDAHLDLFAGCAGSPVDTPGLAGTDRPHGKAINTASSPAKRVEGDHRRLPVAASASSSNSG